MRVDEKTPDPPARLSCRSAEPKAFLNCNGTNDAQATWQRERGSSRNQQLRNGTCAVRSCQEGVLHSHGSHMKHSYFGTGVVAWSPSNSQSCLRKRTRSHQTPPFVPWNKLVCTTAQTRESWICTSDHGSGDCTRVIVAWVHRVVRVAR